MDLRYAVNDVPPWYFCVLLGFQHYLTMLGSTVLIPLLLVPAMGGSINETARVINTYDYPRLDHTVRTEPTSSACDVIKP